MLTTSRRRFWLQTADVLSFACQVSISGQALVFVVRTEKWSFASRAGLLTYAAFVLAQVR